MSTELIPLLLIWFVVFVFSTTLHEAGHALAALRLGDSTAYRGGQVSLNPLPHIAREPVGMVVVPIVSFLLMQGQWMFGWASAPYDPTWAARHPRKAALMSLAGPAGNLLLVLVSVVAIRGGIALGYFEPPFRLGFSEVVSGTGAAGSASVATVVSVLFTLNLVLLVFNLLPLPPLDGSGVIQLAMSESVARQFQQLLANPMWSWVGIVLAWRLFWPVFEPIHRLVIDLVYPGRYFPG